MDKASVVNNEEDFDTRQDYQLAETVGTDFLARLNDVHVPVTDAYWAMSDDNEHRELFVATPLRDDDGLRKTAGVFHDVLYAMTDEERAGLTLSDVAIVSPQSRNVQTMRQRYGRVEYVNGHRVRRINTSSEKPFIYRLNQPTGAASVNGQSPFQGNQTHG